MDLDADAPAANQLAYGGYERPVTTSQIDKHVLLRHPEELRKQRGKLDLHGLVTQRLVISLARVEIISVMTISSRGHICGIRCNLATRLNQSPSVTPSGVMWSAFHFVHASLCFVWVLWVLESSRPPK